jgi:hypothetical protein
MAAKISAPSMVFGYVSFDEYPRALVARRFFSVDWPEFLLTAEPSQSATRLSGDFSYQPIVRTVQPLSGWARPNGLYYRCEHSHSEAL